jgi:hypothetical protein
MHPLVRWQSVGGMAEAQRKAFLLTNIIDAKGRISLGRQKKGPKPETKFRPGPLGGKPTAAPRRG